MAKKKSLHNRHVPHFITVTVIVTGLVMAAAVAGHLYRVKNNAEVASATVKATQFSTARCDIDSNGTVNVTDFQVLNQCVAKDDTCTNKLRKRSDINRDGKVNKSDVQAFRRCQLSVPDPIYPTKSNSGSQGGYQGKYPNEAAYQGGYQGSYTSQAAYQGKYTSQGGYQGSYTSQAGYQGVYTNK